MGHPINVVLPIAGHGGSARVGAFHAAGPKLRLHTHPLPPRAPPARIHATAYVLEQSYISADMRPHLAVTICARSMEHCSHPLALPAVLTSIPLAFHAVLLAAGWSLADAQAAGWAMLPPVGGTRVAGILFVQCFVTSGAASVLARYHEARGALHACIHWVGRYASAAGIVCAGESGIPDASLPCDFTPGPCRRAGGTSGSWWTCSTGKRGGTASTGAQCWCVCCSAHDLSSCDAWGAARLVIIVCRTCLPTSTCSAARVCRPAASVSCRISFSAVQGST